MRLLECCTVALLGQFIAVAVAAAETAPPSISTSGESVVFVRPDEVVLNFGVEVRNVDLDRAVTINDEQSARLVKSLTDAGIAAKHIQTDQMEVTIQYGNHLELEGYITRRGYSVTIKDVDKFEKLIQTGLKNGANRLLGFDYRTTELRKYRDQARSMAIKAAQEKAQALAGDLGCKVGAPRTISEGGGYYGYSRSTWGWQGGNAVAQNSFQAAPDGGGGGEGETMPLGQIAVRASINVTFDLIPPQASR